jgi:predicted nucleotidyltransferase
MIKYSLLPSNINQLLPEAINYLQKSEDIEFAYLFGSFGKGRPFPLSDVDIAIYLKNVKNLSDKRLEILGILIDLLQTDEIDLVILNNAPLILRMKILESRKVIVDHNPFLRHRYESITMREYFDFSIKEANILERKFFHG